MLLEIRDLRVRAENKEILTGLNLTVNAGEVHAIMGPNGSGKSTLASVLAGKNEYEVTGGEVMFEGMNLLDLNPENRARLGIFLAFQYPVEIPGVSTTNFLKAAINEIRKSQGLPPIPPNEFLSTMKKNLAEMEMDLSMSKRSLNEGFSGGEKKRNEIFQMLML